jgi:16S rRNA (cytosine967-C5)-methyltransferase
LTAGLAARQLAVVLISAVLNERRALDEALALSLASRTFASIEGRDRAFARAIAATVLRRHGELSSVVQSYLDKPLPKDSGRLMPILLAGAAQLLMLETPAHAAISLAVDQCRLDRDARRFDKLTNAVLRRISESGAGKLASLDAAACNVPVWMLRRWRETYGEDSARAIAMASLREAPLDLSMTNAEAAGRLGGIVLPTGSVRVAEHGRIEDLPGYADGDWWVQDAAAALPARLLGDVSGRDVADLCAAPGGKTAELAAAGARVTAVEVSKGRLQRVADNLQRLKLDANLINADATRWTPGSTFDAVLLDAPCAATGTIRRHPDILHLKRETDITQLAELQGRLLAHAATLVKPGGLLVYCTCSLEPEEGVEQVAKLLADRPDFTRIAVQPGEAGIAADWISADGDLRTLPTHLALEKPELSGMDGFFAARLKRGG